jgi:hypothetical protein
LPGTLNRMHVALARRRFVFSSALDVTEADLDLSFATNVKGYTVSLTGPSSNYFSGQQGQAWVTHTARQGLAPAGPSRAAVACASTRVPAPVAGWDEIVGWDKSRNGSGCIYGGAPCVTHQLSSFRTAQHTLAAAHARRRTTRPPLLLAPRRSFASSTPVAPSRRPAVAVGPLSTSRPSRLS